jgi:hypothetical protein
MINAAQLSQLRFETEVKIAHAAEATGATFDEIADEVLTVLSELLARRLPPSPSHTVLSASAR